MNVAPLFSVLYIVGYCDMVKLIVWSKTGCAQLCRLPEQESPPCMVRIGRRRHPHRSTQTSASVGADICIGRRRHPHRSAQTSASVDADVLIGGYGIPAIPTQPPPRHPQPSPRSHMYAANCVGIAGMLYPPTDCVGMAGMPYPPTDCVGMAGMPYPPIDSATLCGAYCFA